MKRLERWKPLIDAARDEDQVLAVVREFLGVWSPEELARLPACCRVTRVSGKNDLAAWATTLAREERTLASDGETAVLMAQLSQVLTEASNRMAALALEARLMRPRGADERT